VGDLVGEKYVLKEYLMSYKVCDYWVSSAKGREFVLFTSSANEELKVNIGFEYDKKHKVIFKAHRRQPRDLLGRYELLKVIGSGSSKTVWLALDTFKGRQCAFLLYNRISKSEKVDSSFRQLRKEYRHLCRIRHPNIVKVFDMGMYNKRRPFVTEEVVTGFDLKKRYKNSSLGNFNYFFNEARQCLSGIARTCKGNDFAFVQGFAENTAGELLSSKKDDLLKLDQILRESGDDFNKEMCLFWIKSMQKWSTMVPDYVNEVKDVFKEISSGLSHLHKKGIVHRDIRLENILCNLLAGRPIIIDFGLSMGPEPLYNKGGGILYKAPEVIQKDECSFQSDVWASGVVAYYLLACRFPFTTEKENWEGVSKREHARLVRELNEKIVSQQPEQLRKINPYVPEKLEKIVHTCLEKNRNKRYRNSGEVYSELLKV
jgi:serine/threonine protein kinase